MSCPAGKTKQTCESYGTTGFPTAQPELRLTYKGRQWRPINGDPSPGRLYLIETGMETRLGVTAKKLTRHAAGSMLDTRARKDGDCYVRLCDGHTVLLKGSRWFEPVEFPEPDWEEDPVHASGVFLFNALKEMENNTGYIDEQSRWRVDLPSGAFIMVCQGSYGCLAALFTSEGRRVEGAVCCQSGYESHRVLDGLAQTVRCEILRRENPDAVAGRGTEFEYRGKKYWVTRIDAVEVHSEEENGAEGPTMDLTLFEVLTGKCPVPNTGEQAIEDLRYKLAFDKIRDLTFDYQGHSLAGHAFVHQCLADGYRLVETPQGSFFSSPETQEFIGPLEVSVRNYARHVLPNFEIEMADGEPIGGLLAWPDVTNHAAVRRALQRNVDVPLAVLAQYPDLVEQYGV